MNKSSAVAIGTIGYYIDENSRVYAPGSRGFPLIRGKVRKLFVVGETKQSWIVSPYKGYGPTDRGCSKVSKARGIMRTFNGETRVEFDGAAMELMLWAEGNKHAVADAVTEARSVAVALVLMGDAERAHSLKIAVRDTSPQKLAAVATVLGYEPAFRGPKPDGQPYLIVGCRRENKPGVAWKDQREYLVDEEGNTVDTEGRPIK